MRKSLFAESGVHAVVDGQYGSTGKGVLEAWLAERAYESGKEFKTAMSNAGPNSGHTFYDTGGNKHVLKQLPTFAVATYLMGGKITATLTAGAIIDPEILYEEARRYPGLDIWVHNNAAVITPELKEAEKSGSIAAVAGTRSGTGAALARKIERHPDAIWGNQKLDPNRPRNILSYGWESHSAKNVRVFLEVSQGFSLGIHSRFYPKVTSRECTVAQGMADARLAPYSLSRCYMAIRTFPIRVGNVDGFSSGEWYADQEETSWDDLQQTPELTTVTKRVRRVASFSYEQFMDATAANDPDFVFLNFVNYLPFNEAKKLARQLRALRGNIHYLYGTSPYSNGVRDVL